MNDVVITTRPHTYCNFKTIEMFDGVVHEIGCTYGDGVIHEIVVVWLDPVDGARIKIMSINWQSDKIDMVIAGLAKAKELIAEFQIANHH
jgi:hypothetical protein